MSNVKRVFVEKKPEFAVAAKALRHEIRHYLGIRSVSGVRVLNRYDVEDLSDETFEKACRGVFAELPVDVLYKETFPMKEGDHSFSVEYLPGQFDQRADSAEQCVRFIKEDEVPVIRTATTYVIEGGYHGGRVCSHPQPLYQSGGFEGGSGREAGDAGHCI